MAVDTKGTVANSWLTTYGDMVTLLLTFFLLMIVILNEAEDNIYKMLNMLLDETESSLNQYVEKNKLEDYLQVQRTTKGVQLTISGGYYFDINSSVVKAELRPILEHIGNTVKQSRLINLKNDKLFAGFYNSLIESKRDVSVEIRVEGHTDNMPILSGKFSNNWELSSARALEVVQYLNKMSGIDEKKFSALGYGEFRPIATNDTREGRSKNRRVEIFIDANITEINGIK